MKCSNCGKDTPKGSTFCSHCGSRMDRQAVTHTKEFSLDRTALREWRDRFSSFDGWEVGKPFGDSARKLLGTLNPPFVPEQEALVFDPGLNSTQYKVAEITYKNVVLRDGFFFATDSRLIFGNQDLAVAGQKGIALQIPYEEIRAVYMNNDIYSLILRDGSESRVRTKVPRPSLLGAIAILGGSPADKANISRMEREKAEMAQEFVATFMGFFTEIAEENRQRFGDGPSTPVIELQAVSAAASTEASLSSPAAPLVIQNPWYRSTGFLLAAFLFFTPLWSILMLTDDKQTTGVKVVAGAFIAFYLMLLVFN